MICRERKTNRLKDYDYAENGYYFVTICSNNQTNWFGEIKDGKMIPNRNGEIVRKCWNDLPVHYQNVKLDVYNIMPNHSHGIIAIENKPLRAGLKPAPTLTKNHGLSEIIRGFKTFSSRRINEELKIIIKFQWQRSFYDHVIRDEQSMNKIREYIVNNPLKWELDIENINTKRDSKSKDYYQMIIKGKN